MNLGEKIAWVIENYKPNHENKVVEYYTTSSDNHVTVHSDVLPQDSAIESLKRLAKAYEKHGECVGSDSKGHLVRVTDFELVDTQGVTADGK